MNESCDIQQQKDELERLLAARERYIQDLLNSFSWRITAPIRWLNSRLFHLGGKQGRKPVHAHTAAAVPNDFLPTLLSRQDQNSVYSRSTQVDVIIPVYDAYDCTTDCIHSVFRNSANCHLIIINDASGDPRIAAFLSELRAVPELDISLTILTNETNCGFVKSVNRAFTHTRNHFVILNSDTVVPPGWLDRLTAPLFSLEHVATVTPFTNAGVICSFPEFCVDNDLIPGLTLAAQDAFFRDYGPAEPVAIPTGVGFCMAFNRKAVSQLGLFDEHAFPRGYGEENDFCMRALKAGWYHVMVGNLFVYHRHGASFGTGEKKRLIEQGEQQLAARHPEYGNLIREFMDRDPLRPVREALKLLMQCKRAPQGTVVALLDHDLGGGANYYSEHLAQRLVAASCSVIHLKMNPDTGLVRITLKTVEQGESLSIAAPTADHLHRLLQLCEVGSIVVNELVGWPTPPELFRALAKSGIPYTVLLHDYFPVCPNWNLLDPAGRFCGCCADTSRSSRCLQGNAVSGAYTLYGDRYTDISAWRAAAAEYLAKARAIICFSEASRRILLDRYGTLPAAVVVEHAVSFPGSGIGRLRSLKDGVLRVGVLGCAGVSKGATIVEQLAAHPALSDLPVELVVLGDATTVSLARLSTYARITLHGRYRREELASLVDRYDIQVMLIPSIWPETFSFTVSEALLLGCPVVCFDLGAQAERVKRYDSGIVVAEVSAEAVLGAFANLVAQPARVAEMSHNALNYSPPSADDHFTQIFRLMGIPPAERAR
jgi:GT2 family glycosyltransferase/glycosyltransferase involved in cell wall biosynthesis